MLKKISIIFLTILLANSAYAQKIKHPGQEISGLVKLSYMTKINLPPGNWEVVSKNKVNGGVGWVDVSLIQTEGNKIKAIAIIQYPTNTSAYGWYKSSDDICDDYSNQQSNFHQKKVKENAGYIMSGFCANVWTSNWIAADSWDSWDTMEKIHTYIANNNLNYPPALTMLDSKWFSKENLVTIYYMYNPEFNGLATNAKVNFKKSDWHKYNIDKHPSKKLFIDKAVNMQNKTILNSLKSFSKRKPIDLSLYDFE
tara:strand:- start:223 stop:984 length:762 start_codon:yes stop_codon:yes gene_type:complete